MIKQLLLIIMEMGLLGEGEMIEEVCGSGVEIGYEKRVEIIFGSEVKQCKGGNEDIVGEKVSGEGKIMGMIGGERKFGGERNVWMVRGDSKLY